MTCCNLQGLGGYEICWKMDDELVPKSHQNRAIGRPWSSFSEIWGGFESMCCLMSFWIDKHRPQVQKISDFDRQIDSGRWFCEGVGGRGGVPGDWKSWGFEDCMYLLSDLARRTQRVGGFDGYRLCRRPRWELVLVDFVMSVSILSVVIIVGRQMNRPSCEYNPRSVWCIFC